MDKKYLSIYLVLLLFLSFFVMFFNRVVRISFDLYLSISFWEVAIVCYLNVPQRPIVLKPWSQRWHYWEIVEPLRGGVYCKTFRSMGECPWVAGPLPLPLSFASLPWGKKFWYTNPYLDMLTQNRPKVKGINWSWNGTSKALSQNKTFLFIS